MSGSGGDCWSCGASLSHLDYGRADRCHKCGRDTRACKGCVHYDQNHYNECREPQADRVVDKERSNFCDYFKPSIAGSGGKNGAGDGQSPAEKARALAEALFKK